MTDPWDEGYIYWKVRVFCLFYSWIIWEGIGQPEFSPPFQTNLTRNWVLQKNPGWDTQDSWVMLGLQAVRFVGMLVCNHGNIWAIIVTIGLSVYIHLFCTRCNLHAHMLWYAVHTSKLPQNVWYPNSSIVGV